MKKIVLAASLLLGSASLMATEKYSYEISPIIGYNIAEGNINVDDYMMYGAEFQFNNLFDSAIKPEISVLYGTTDYDTPALDGKDTDVLRIGLNGVYEFAKTEAIVPFVKAGMGYENFSDNYDSGNHNSVYVDAGVGAKFPFSERFSLKTEAIYFAKNNAARWDSNLGLFVGLTYAFWENEPTKPVVVDSDNDGVIDSEDQCPNTPAGAKVNASGCELDSDNDGVVDSKDQCPLSAAGAKVDANGCEIDSDNDGVVDSADECPNTPAGVKVNASGCELDSDSDGVVDSKDKCPNTPVGVTVDDLGCVPMVNLFITFETGSTKVDAQSQQNIKKFAEFLKAVPQYSVTIIGYTDSVGSAASNQKLSQKRAEAVRELIIAEGVEASRVKAVGKGEADPIASNATAEGRAKNRRIEAKLEK